MSDARRSLPRLASLCCALVAGSLFGRAAAADGWADQGRVLVSGALSVENVSADSASVTTVAFTPGVRYFAATHLAVGAELQIAHISSGVSATLFTLLPSIGYDLALADHVSLVPQLELAFSTQSGSSTTLTRFAMGGFLPVVVHPPGHFFIGFGPEVLADVSTSASNSNVGPSKTTTIGARSIIGAYF